MVTKKKIANDVYVITNKKIDTSVLVQFGVTDASYSDQSSRRIKVKGDHIAWGPKDSVLLKFHKIATESPNKWRLLKTRRDFIIGAGIDVVTREFINGQKEFNIKSDPETQKIYQWLEDSDYSKLTRAKALDYCFCGRYFIKIILELDGSVKLERVDVFHCRPAKMDPADSEIKSYIINGNFGTSYYRRVDDVELPAFDKKNPTKYAVSILDVKEDLPGQVYNPFSEWWGTEAWADVANEIPKFHKSGLKNGYNVKYHISIPDDYFSKEEYEPGEDEKTLRERVLNEMGDALSGVENADKTLVTYHKVLGEGRYAESGVKITALKNEMSDDAYTKLFETANKVSASGHGVSPVLAGVDTGGKLGGSGKELEASANYHQGFLTSSDRALMFEDIMQVKKILGWSSDKFFKFENIELYNYDVTPTAASTNPNQPNQADANAN
jgi:hypothetical protein